MDISELIGVLALEIALIALDVLARIDDAPRE
jgi:hypothetical protein